MVKLDTHEYSPGYKIKNPRRISYAEGFLIRPKYISRKVTAVPGNGNNPAEGFTGSSENSTPDASYP